MHDGDRGARSNALDMWLVVKVFLVVETKSEW